jgi:hypothetical protein
MLICARIATSSARRIAAGGVTPGFLRASPRRMSGPGRRPRLPVRARPIPTGRERPGAWCGGDDVEAVRQDHLHVTFGDEVEAEAAGAAEPERVPLADWLECQARRCAEDEHLVVRSAVFGPACCRRGPRPSWRRRR